MGYSGWDEGQLESEMTEKSWLITNVNARLVYQTPAEKIWRNSVLQTGPENSMLIHYPTDPQLN